MKENKWIHIKGLVWDSENMILSYFDENPGDALSVLASHFFKNFRFFFSVYYFFKNYQSQNFHCMEAYVAHNIGLKLG